MKKYINQTIIKTKKKTHLLLKYNALVSSSGVLKLPY